VGIPASPRDQCLWLSLGRPPSCMRKSGAFDVFLIHFSIFFQFFYIFFQFTPWHRKTRLPLQINSPIIFLYKSTQSKFSELGVLEPNKTYTRIPCARQGRPKAQRQSSRLRSCERRKHASRIRVSRLHRSPCSNIKRTYSSPRVPDSVI
jgi:hypothetical protein